MKKLIPLMVLALSAPVAFGDDHGHATAPATDAAHATAEHGATTTTKAVKKMTKKMKKEEKKGAGTHTETHTETTSETSTSTH
ncbi:MAG: hypothetical protein AB7P04_13740 [Bacteriovoracia bacterium]